VQALQALLQLAQDPQVWLSVSSVAAAQELPAPMLEQLLLDLRRAGLVEARRGRQGGYRLARPPAAIRVAEVFSAVGAPLDLLEPEAPGARAEQQGQGPEQAQELGQAQARALGPPWRRRRPRGRRRCRC
jgi:Rrf2 family protein